MSLLVPPLRLQARHLPTRPSTIFSTLLPQSYEQSHRHVVVQLGGYWGSQGLAQDINIKGLVGNQYTLTNNNSGNGLFGLGYYIDGPDKDRFQLGYGINGFYLSTTPVNGTIILEHFLTNFNYSYDIQHIPVYMAAKAIIKNNHQKYNMTLDAGIGPNFMRVSNYNESPLTDGALAKANFAAHNNVTFSAMAGVGVRLNNTFGQAPLECAYRFFYLGQGQMQINNNLYQNTLKTGSTYANAILCSITV